MFTHTDRNKQFSDTFQGKTRKRDRRDRIAAKSAYLIDGLTVKAL
jgi:hypothetical protein